MIFPNGYFVDGKKPELPSNIIEVDVIDNAQPLLDENQTASIEWKLTDKGWEKLWSVSNKLIAEWHKEKQFRVTVNNEVWKDWFAKKRDHADYLELTGQQLYPDLIALLDVVKSIDNTNIVNDSENTYVYLDEVFDFHVPIISKYNAIVEQKPTNQ